MQLSKSYIIATLVWLVSLGVNAQVNSDSSKTEMNRPSTRGVVPGPRPYKEVITAKAISTEGMFKVHRIDSRILFEIPIKLLNRDILSVGRITAASAKTLSDRNRNTAFAGDQVSENMIAFVKGTKNKIFLQQRSVIEQSSDSTQPMSHVVKRNNIQPVLLTFDVKAYTPDSSAVVIDITDFIMGDNDIFGFERSAKSQSGGLSTLEADKSYFEKINSYPINIEVKTVKTYKIADGTLTYGLNTSLVLLPEQPMRPRYSDVRVGYFSNRIVDYSTPDQQATITGLLARWRLEPKPEDKEKYFRGELVEPIKPIVIYIDPATPKKWVPYLIAGVNDWQVAFEQAGFKNAIMAKEAPLNDSTWSLENAMYSAIVYKPSSIANASGPHISDPRSGEILETHINWYHNVMDLVYKWYFIQCANVDPRVRKPVIDEKLMGTLIRFVSSHEVGHTLGLAHNFGSSSSVPVELLRNKAWVEANGHTPSIMDYARFNYVAQPQDNISENGLFPRIGVYDKWAIQYGYKLYPDTVSLETETEWMNKLVSDSLKANKFLIYGPQQSSDPRDQSEVLSNNPMKANTYAINNLKAVLPHLNEWTAQPNMSYELSREMYKGIFDQYSLYMKHAMRYLIGRQNDYVYNGRPEVKPVPTALQKEAVQFLNEQLFKTPEWLISIPDAIDKFGFYPRLFTNLHEEILGTYLLDNGVIETMLNNEYFYNDTYKASDYLNDLTKGIMSEVYNNKAVTGTDRRNLQRLYINRLTGKLKPGAFYVVRVAFFAMAVPSNPEVESDQVPLIKEHLRSLSAGLKSGMVSNPDPETRKHFSSLYDEIQIAFTQARTKNKWNIKK